MVLMYIDKFEDAAAAISYSFLLNRYQLDVPGTLRNRRIDTNGIEGSFDQLGPRPGIRETVPYTIRTMPVLSTPTLAEAEIKAMRAKLWRIGRGKLFWLLDNNDRYWMWARAASQGDFTRDSEVGASQRHFGASVNFDVEPGWFATTQTAPMASAVTSSPQIVTVNNPGNYPTRGAAGLVIRIRSNSSAGWGSSLVIGNATTGESITIAGFAATSANDEIKIDCDAKSILFSTDNGVTYPTSAWAATTLGRQNGLMSLDVGNNDITFTTNAGSPNFNAEFTFYAAY